MRLTPRALLTGAAVLALAGCDLHPHNGGLVADLPDAIGVEESPHLVPAIDPKKVQIPDSPRKPLPSELGPVMPRSAWTAAGPDLRQVRPMNGVKLVTFHHSGDGKALVATDAASVARHLEAVRQFHRQRGMCDIGYHFAIDYAGNVWQLRHLRYEGQHVRVGANGQRWNEHNIGVVVLGDFTKQEVSPAQKKAIVTFATFLRRHYSLPPSAIRTHQELVKTTCPGRLQPVVAQARKGAN